MSCPPLEFPWYTLPPLTFLSNSRKISAHEFERGGLLKPIVNTIDGTPTFLSINSQHDHHNHTHHHTHSGVVQNQNGTTNSIISRTQRLSRNELRHLDEKEMIFELVRGEFLWRVKGRYLHEFLGVENSRVENFKIFKFFRRKNSFLSLKKIPKI